MRVFRLPGTDGTIPDIDAFKNPRKTSRYGTLEDLPLRG